MIDCDMGRGKREEILSTYQTGMIPTSLSSHFCIITSTSTSISNDCATSIDSSGKTATTENREYTIRIDCHPITSASIKTFLRCLANPLLGKFSLGKQQTLNNPWSSSPYQLAGRERSAFTVSHCPILPLPVIIAFLL